MQGMFQLGIVGSREEMMDFIEKFQENKMLKYWFFEEEEKEIDDKLCRFEGSGLKNFLDKYKLVIKVGDSCNISGIEETADAISKISPELEVVLLTQYLDSCSFTDWFVYYCPSGKMHDVTQGAMIVKGAGNTSWYDVQLFSGIIDISIDIDEVWEYYKKNECSFDFERKFTKEILEYFIAEQAGTAEGEAPEDYDEKYDACNDLLDEFFYSTMPENSEYSYEPDDKNLPSLAYVSRLFGEKFVEHYRFISQTFDKRFEGKVFIVIGEPDDYGRKKAELLISKFGGVVGSRLSGKTNYLLLGKYADKSRIAKAKELGTQILDVDEFEKMISE